MKSWVLLLAALLSARLRLGNAEGDPLPQSLVNLVWNSPISSVEDLKLLLQQEASAIDKEDEHHDLLNPTHGRYIRSVVEPQVAEPAVCKVRTEVMEITRSMLDRNNAHFMLWPPCVEVQRCSGCCNSDQLQCVATVTSRRYLKVLKIQFKNKKPQYDNVVIPVEDDVSCSCQRSAPSSSSSSSSAAFVSQPNPLAPPPQKPPASSNLPLSPPRTPHALPPKTQTSKADLHRLDDLKHNQHHHLPHERDPLARQWQQGSYTQLVRWTQPRVHQAPTHVHTGVHHTTAGFQSLVGTRPSEAMAKHTIMESPQQVGHGSGLDKSQEETGEEIPHHDHEQRQQQLLKHQQRQEHQYHPHPPYPQQYTPGDEDQELRAQYLLHAPQSDSSLSKVSITQAPKTVQDPTFFTSVTQKDSITNQKYTKEIPHELIETKGDGQKEGTEMLAKSRTSSQTETTNHKQEKDSNLNEETGHLTEQERRQRLLEIVQREPEKTPVLHAHQRPKPTTFNSAVLSTVAPMSTAGRQVPFRPAFPRRRKRKHRKRISKAAMRAMIM
ncbi:putative mediator of RNA polymerase II transcription subunit 12 isoform X3 [Cyprinodon tularosa]|uniref:putative mediator of RNA polymerase II transcription subunit 12 isoform X3 n=1 Tax=Cyprinodon tularosa TaxID=77115 RepID=UPI0018E281A0|nr:putative mediator of RNA polymerase II transcription subunit 12 isoform X3 [Cyprinodon tularosa]